MIATKPMMKLSAADLMTHPVVLIPREMSLQGAAHLLLNHHISGAPVVDVEGRCVGILSGTDFVHWAKHHDAREEKPVHEDGEFWNSWQMAPDDRHAATLVSQVMTPDPVMALAGTRMSELARMMLDAHIHRIIVVDEARHPIGVVSSTDLLAVIAQAETQPGEPFGESTVSE